MAYDLIIFDCDGTLVDSEYLCNKVVSEILAEQGLPQYDLDYAMEHFIAQSATVVFDTVERETGRRLPPDIVMQYERRVNEGMARWMRPIEGVAETLAGLHGRLPLCIGSNGERSNVVSSLVHAGLRQYFNDNVIFTKELVQNPKPAPDLFLLAAREMGVVPMRTLVVEDSIAGTKAGKAAGMKVIALTAAYHDKASHEGNLRSAGADYVTDRFVNIPRLARL